jgi:DNA-directed RNA polymerase omega subunit
MHPEAVVLPTALLAILRRPDDRTQDRRPARSRRRAREINSYYSQLGEGRAEFIPPLIESGGLTNKPLSIALEEIAEGKIDYERPEEPVDE